MHTFWFIYIFSQTPSAGALSTQSPPPVIWGVGFFFYILHFPTSALFTFQNKCIARFMKIYLYIKSLLIVVLDIF